MAKKECSGCGSMLGVRTKECPDCGHKFLIRKRGPRPKQIDWTELKTGDTIKVVTGTGPYFMSKDRAGEKIMMGQKGRFEVVELYGAGRPKGCGVVGRQTSGKKHRASVIEHIYMGDTYYNDNLNIHEEPHKILGIQTEATIIEKPNKKKKQNKKTKEVDVDVEALNDLIASL
jgi:DNA-directed RNA polymerase subunit RPC12/RpoP